MKNKLKTLAILGLTTMALIAMKPTNVNADQNQPKAKKQLTVQSKKPKNLPDKLFDYVGIGINWGTEHGPGAISQKADYQSGGIEIFGGSYLDNDIPVLSKIIDRYEGHLEVGRHKAKLADRTETAYPIMLTLWLYKDFDLPKTEAEGFIGMGGGFGYMNAKNYPALGDDPLTGNYAVKLGTRFNIGKKGNKGTFFLKWDHISKPFQTGDDKQYIGHEGDTGVNTIGAGVTVEFDWKNLFK